MSDIQIPDPKTLGKALFETVKETCSSNIYCIQKYRYFDEALFFVKEAIERATGEKLPDDWMDYAKALTSKLAEDNNRGWDEFEEAYREAYNEWMKSQKNTKVPDATS